MSDVSQDAILNLLQGEVIFVVVGRTYSEALLTALELARGVTHYVAILMSHVREEEAHASEPEEERRAVTTDLVYVEPWRDVIVGVPQCSVVGAEMAPLTDVVWLLCGPDTFRQRVHRLRDLLHFIFLCLRHRCCRLRPAPVSRRRRTQARTAAWRGPCLGVGALR